jgi:hypothetical protein
MRLLPDAVQHARWGCECALHVMKPASAGRVELAVMKLSFSSVVNTAKKTCIDTYQQMIRRSVHVSAAREPPSLKSHIANTGVVQRTPGCFVGPGSGSSEASGRLVRVQ